MVVVAGCLIAQKSKILMVKEATKAVYGQWNIPAGRVDEHELKSNRNGGITPYYCGSDRGKL